MGKLPEQYTVWAMTSPWGNSKKRRQVHFGTVKTTKRECIASFADGFGHLCPAEEVEQIRINKIWKELQKDLGYRCTKIIFTITGEQTLKGHICYK